MQLQYVVHLPVILTLSTEFYDAFGVYRAGEERQDSNISLMMHEVPALALTLAAVSFRAIRLR
jgi:hypothetical protein